MRTLFVVNPNAGRRRCGKRWEVLHRLLQTRTPQLPYDVVFTSGPQDAERFAQQAAAEGYECVYAVGGDGTFHEVLNGIGDADVVLGLIPFGTGNDLARALGVPKKPGLLAEMLQRPRVSRVNAAELQGRRYMLAAGFGFDGIVAHHINTHNAIKNMGSLGYAVSAFSVLRWFKPATLRLEVDGEERTINGAWMVVVANAPFYGGGMRICPEAAVDDDCLDICVVSNLTRMRFIRLFPKVYAGTHIHLREVVQTLRGRRVVIERPAYMQGHVDGELFAHRGTTLEISLSPRRFRVVAPAVVQGEG